MSEVTKVSCEDLARAHDMLRIAAEYIRDNWPDATINYDDAECDGYCVADDCESAAEMIGFQVSDGEEE